MKKKRDVFLQYSWKESEVCTVTKGVKSTECRVEGATDFILRSQLFAVEKFLTHEESINSYMIEMWISNDRLVFRESQFSAPFLRIKKQPRCQFIVIKTNNSKTPTAGIEHV